jgi:hypothetical protein
MQRRPLPELRAHRTQQLEIGKRIPRSLQEQHRNRNLGKVLGSFCSRLVGRMQRKTEEHQSSHSLQRLLCGSLRGHPSPHGLATRQQRQAGSRLRRRSHCCSDGRGQNSRCVRNPPLLLHIGKLISQRRHTHPGQFAGQLLHKGVTHARPSPMCKHQEPQRLSRPTQQRRHLASTRDRKA